jgi:capsular polysaccharide export protein
VPHRTFLFLQGLASPFFYRLAGLLRAAGHDVLRINLSGADLVFWPESAINFRQSAKHWPAFVAKTMREHHVTDLVLFGDCRPCHRTALQAARRLGIATHIFEEGYLRPNWITLERLGTNGYSEIPRDPDAIRELAGRLVDAAPAIEMRGSFVRRALWDVTANIIGLGLWPLFPHYRWHGTDHPVVEYCGWLRRFATAPVSRRRTRQTIANVVDAGAPFYLAPLQLHSDYQIRVHSPYADPIDAVEEIVASFVAHAPADAHLIFKLHPLDNTLFNYSGKLAQIAGRQNIARRLHLIGETDLPTLLRRSRGVVVVNSSLGTVAIEHNRPVKTLGTATYDMPGLTFQGSLDAFWTNGVAPDAALYRDYKRVVLALTQVNGGFFGKDAIEIGTRLVAERILASPSGAPLAAAAGGRAQVGLDFGRPIIVPGE